MTVEKGVRLLAGSFVMLGVALGVEGCPVYVSRHFLLLPAFVGFMLAQSVFTGICPAAIILKALGLKSAGS